MAHWWETTPWRMVQTNLPEPDMADIDAAAFAKSLKDFGATVVNLNAAGIIASYETQLDFQPRSAYLTGDNLRRIIEECHQQGLRVIARTDFSRIRQDVYEQHPEWAARLADGSVVNYNGYISVCPNSDYQNTRVFEILRELFDTHPFDGLFCNMSGYLLTDYSGRFYGLCQCETCRKKYQSETGKDVPETGDSHSPALREYAAFHARCNAQKKEKLADFVKALNPELAVNGVDFVRSEVGTEYGRSNWIYKASSNSRLAAGTLRTRPSDDASVDFIGFRHRFISVSPALMALRQWQNLANSGCVSLYIMGRLDNHRDTSCFKPTQRVFQFHKEHEALFAGLQSAAQVLLVHAGDWHRTDAEAQGWIRILTENHVPFDELPLSDLRENNQLSEKRLVILPDISNLSQRQASLIDAFAYSGGTVVATGSSALVTGNAALHCLGVAKVQEIRTGLRASMLEIPQEEQDAFPNCMQTPYLDIGEELVCVTPEKNSKGYLRLIPEHPFGPPECCCFEKNEPVHGLVVSSYGKGRGLYLPWKGAALYQREGYTNPACFLQDILFSFCGLPKLAPKLTPMTELTMCRKKGLLLIQLVNTTGCFANSWFELVPVYKIHLLLPGIYGTAKTLNGGHLTTQQTNDGLEITLDILKEYEAIAIEESIQ